jgi:hypothetical protein
MRRQGLTIIHMPQRRKPAAPSQQTQPLAELSDAEQEPIREAVVREGGELLVPVLVQLVKARVESAQLKKTLAAYQGGGA